MPKHYARKDKTRLDDKINWPTNELNPEKGKAVGMEDDPTRRQPQQPPHP